IRLTGIVYENIQSVKAKIFAVPECLKERIAPQPDQWKDSWNDYTSWRKTLNYSIEESPPMLQHKIIENGINQIKDTICSHYTDVLELLKSNRQALDLIQANLPKATGSNTKGKRM